jgi:hypothetical protein
MMSKKYRVTATLPVVVNAYVEAESIDELWAKVEMDNSPVKWISVEYDRLFDHHQDIYDYEVEEVNDEKKVY